MTSLVMMLREERGLFRHLSGLLQRDTTPAHREETLGRHGDPNSDDADHFFAPHLAPFRVADDVNLVADDLVLAKVVHVGDFHRIKLDNFQWHLLALPSPLAADEHCTTAFANRKSVSFFALQERSVSGPRYAQSVKIREIAE